MCWWFLSNKEVDVKTAEVLFLVDSLPLLRTDGCFHPNSFCLFFFCVQNEMMESFLICLPPSLSPFLPCRTGLKWADPTERQLGRGGRDRFDRRLARNAIIAGWTRFDYCFFFGLFFFHSRTRARYRAHDGILWDGRPEENDPMKAEFGVGQWTEAKFSSFFLAPAMEKKEGNRKNIRTQPNALTYAGTQH